VTSGEVSKPIATQKLARAFRNCDFKILMGRKTFADGTEPRGRRLNRMAGAADYRT
jgi:hypothetical protein